jgi:serine/threonine protein phosphatase PrpC
VGRVRTDNEDRSLARPPVFAVADGMGGHQAGEVAADLAIACLDDTGRPGQTPDGRQLVDAIQHANAAIRLESRTRPELLGMGTTCTALVVDEVVTIAHVGDSRAYRLRAGRLERLTEDHSLVAAMVRDGRLDPAAAATDARRHVITRALGADDDIAVDLVTVDRLPGDRLLLCSDGIHGQVDDGTIERVLADATDPGAAADRLIELAAAAGGEDNATVIVIDPDAIPLPIAAGPIGTETVDGDDQASPSTPPSGTRRLGRPRRRTLLLAIGVVVLGVSALVVAFPFAEPAPKQPTLGIANGTSLTVTVLVNGQPIGTFPPGGGQSAIGGPVLPALPWAVEARTASGRLLTSMDVKAGSVWATTRPDGSLQQAGTMGRVDLSCGRLTIWAGDFMPSGGPVPSGSPGTPGDCAP